MNRFTKTSLIAAFGAFTLLGTPVAGLAQHAGHHADSTPAAAWSCDHDDQHIGSTPEGDAHGDHAMSEGMSATPTSTPEGDGHGNHAATDEAAEFDQLYLDMMLPHHGSVIALSEAALAHLTDPRLIEIAEAIISAQTAENEQLTTWRTEWYGSGEPATDEASMIQMLEAMPVGTMDEMMLQMDATAQVSAFCAAENPDLAFIEQVIPHHQMAIDVSEIAVEQAVHPELAEFAEGVITAQQAEIDQLEAIRAELGATPES
jgi:uncharacterized protein (DUF305 family)